MELFNDATIINPMDPKCTLEDILNIDDEDEDGDVYMGSITKDGATAATRRGIIVYPV